MRKAACVRRLARNLLTPPTLVPIYDAAGGLYMSAGKLPPALEMMCEV